MTFSLDPLVVILLVVALLAACPDLAMDHWQRHWGNTVPCLNLLHTLLVSFA
jgi:hypothetical protein